MQMSRNDPRKSCGCFRNACPHCQRTWRKDPRRGFAMSKRYGVAKKRRMKGAYSIRYMPAPEVWLDGYSYVSGVFAARMGISEFGGKGTIVC